MEIRTAPPEGSDRPTRYGYQRKRVENWSQLRPGDVLLLIEHYSGNKFKGIVDAVASDGSVCWLILEAGKGRKLFHHVDGYCTLADPRPKPKLK